MILDKRTKLLIPTRFARDLVVGAARQIAWPPVRSRVLGLLGPRQAGEMTLANGIAAKPKQGSWR